MKHDERIFKRLREHYDAIKDEHEVVGIFLQGSQNYGLDVYDDDYQSDIDSKAIVLPTLDDILYNRSPKSTTKILDNNEHIDIKDVRVIFDTFKKQNINFIEILFTKYKIINPKYRDIVNELLAHNEEIAHLNTHQAIRCMVGMSKEKLKALKHPYPNIIEKIEKYGYSAKQLHHIVRINEFLNKYVQGKTYSECLQSDNKEYLIGIKKSVLNLEDAEKLALEYDGATYDLKQQVVIGDDKVDNNAIDILNKIKADLIKRHLVAELKQSTEIKEQPFVPKNIFVISDNHFYHENVIEFEQRPFKNVEDMNTQMVAKWNSVVQDGDLVYILGDFSFGNARQTNEILGQLNGKKILIVGNHDLFINDKKFDNTLFFDIKHYEEIELNGTKYTMTHYPFASNNDKGIFLHGHIHSNNGVHKVDNLPKNSINVGVDVNNYTPINIESIKMI